MATTTDFARPSATGAENEIESTTTTAQKLREQADAVVQRIQPQIAAVSTYARNEPTKALLISAAAGAALMGLVALVVRSSGRSSPSSAVNSAMAAIRNAALDLADSAQNIAADALDSARTRAADAIDRARGRANAAAADAADATQSRAAAALDAARSRASAAADTVSETVAETLKKVRDQAAPVVDKVRPQVEAAASYVREDPTRAALGLAVAGALVAGLVALARHSSSDDPFTY
jgi:ElaB/YqjD/DUF883 family membrane-anchored ribosome-binding protein